MQETKLTRKQQAFVDEYLVDLNGTQAAIRAGYSQRSAKQLADSLLKKPHVADAVNAAILDRQDRTKITQDRVLEEMARIAFANMGDFITIDETGTPILDFSRANNVKLASVAQITQEVYMEGRGEDAVPVKKTVFKLHDKGKHLEMLGRHLGLFARDNVTTEMPWEKWMETIEREEGSDDEADLD